MLGTRRNTVLGNPLTTRSYKAKITRMEKYPDLEGNSQLDTKKLQYR